MNWVSIKVLVALNTNIYAHNAHSMYTYTYNIVYITIFGENL